MTSAGSAERLYTPAVLALAVELAKVPLADHQRIRGSARSKSCGSTLDIGLSLDEHATIESIGMQVSACAIGQASAALFARHAKGQDKTAIASSMRNLQSWLAGETEHEPWPEIGSVAAARAFPARHGAILLPWRAAMDALSKT